LAKGIIELKGGADLKCPHCTVEIHAETRWIYLGGSEKGDWAVEKYVCPNPECSKFILYLVLGDGVFSSPGSLRGMKSVKKRFMVYPKGSNRPPVPSEVPQMFADDYTEACLVLPDSPKSSAALSRRCLQNLLREKAGVKHTNLADEIQQVIDSRTLPSHLVDVIDAIRNVGNFATHPIKSQKTGEILPVEPEEAEWNLDVLEALFDFYFVQPSVVKKKRTALDNKLGEAGKKPMK
jgi:hypothetical protein